jgi:hypothetical protein
MILSNNLTFKGSLILILILYQKNYWQTVLDQQGIQITFPVSLKTILATYLLLIYLILILEIFMELLQILNTVIMYQ